MMSSAAVQAQQEEAGPERVVIDILVEQPSDPVIIERCERVADEARIAGEIVVCRERREQGARMFDKPDWERRYAEATQGMKTPDVDGSGLRAPGGGLMVPIVTISLFAPEEPPLLIDVEALPEAPQGSDADLIARGLDPVGDPDGEDTISEAELGLPPRPSAEPEQP